MNEENQSESPQGQGSNLLLDAEGQMPYVEGSEPFKVKGIKSPLRMPAIQKRGRVELIMGCIFSGKTTELLRRCRLHTITGKRVLKVKFQADNFYKDEENITTHGGIRSSAMTMNRLSELGQKFMDYDVIGVDAGQFFVDLVEFTEKAANNGKIVIVSSL